MNSIYILGVYIGHTATAALMKDGEIVACASEERFNNVKNYLGFPGKAIEWCLAEAKIEAKDLETVVVTSLFVANFQGMMASRSRFSPISIIFSLLSLLRRVWRRIVYYVPFLQPISRAGYRVMNSILQQSLQGRSHRQVADFLKIPLDKIRHYDHHLLHAATGYYASPYNTQKALVLTLDAEGDDGLCATVNVFEGATRTRLAATSREHSLGWLYLWVTKYLGMKPMEHEFKVMGLAPYSKDKDTNRVYPSIESLIALNPRNRLEFKAKFNLQDSYYFLRRAMEGFRFDNIAAAFQKLLEERVLEWVEQAIKETGLTTLVLSGGVFMNVKANQRIVALSKVKQIFVPPSAGDESLPIGACYLAYQDVMKSKGLEAKLKPIEDIYWGCAFTNKEIESYLHGCGAYKKHTVKKCQDIEVSVAKLLADGNVVARLNGKMEFGARSLGNRSILAHPQNTDIVMVINEQMKDRDFWMPFAPSILEERIDAYCLNPHNIFSPYMMFGFDTTQRAVKEIKAALHPYDFTARPQFVRQSWNPKYHRLISEFEKLTGIGGVLNTSFNLHGFPIVKGPKEAMEAFEKSGLQYLAMEDYLVSKKSAL